MKSLCNKDGVLFILDEVMSSKGRMGEVRRRCLSGPSSSREGPQRKVHLHLHRTALQASRRWAQRRLWVLEARYQAEQKVIVEEKVIENAAVVGPHFGALLRSCLTGPNARRGGAAERVHVRAGRAGARVEERGASTMGSSLDALKGNHCRFSPAHNVTKEDVEKIVDIFIKSVEVLDANGM
ncbi:hypothetical protein C8Q74DRAFT_1366011 [Fomes fomentarius]|nr:hypothetical protein C8Q74DRAFT_1366011 [Fomes fomentarius]